MTLFSSTGRRILLSPDNEATSESKDGDLYVHTCALNIQMWARVDGLWKEAYEGLSHPKLSTHCLYRNSKNNRVGWVQKRTVITYNSRNKQQQRICECCFMKYAVYGISDNGYHSLAPSF